MTCSKIPGKAHTNLLIFSLASLRVEQENCVQLNYQEWKGKGVVVTKEKFSITRLILFLSKRSCFLANDLH